MCMYVTCAYTYITSACTQCAGIYVGFQEENVAKRAIDGLSQKVESGGNPQICGADTRVLEGKNLSICCVVGIN